MHRTLLAVGAGLIVVSLFVTLVLSSVDPLWAGQHMTLLAVSSWAQMAALVLGSALIAAGLVVARLAPPPVDQKDARRDASSDWFA